MIGLLQGEVLDLALDRVTVMVSGVGFEVMITARHSLKLKRGEQLTLHTKMVVREDDISLFGFETASDRELFNQLCSVNGIGPKLALTTLSGMDSNALRTAISEQNELAFRSISGIGPKTAKLIILSLSEKVSAPHAGYSTVLDALAGLGTDPKKAAAVLSELEPGLSDAEALKAALAKLSRGKI